MTEGSAQELKLLEKKNVLKRDKTCRAEVF